MIFGQYGEHFSLHRGIIQYLTWIIIGFSSLKDTEYYPEFFWVFCINVNVNIDNPIFFSGKSCSLQFVTSYILKSPNNQTKNLQCTETGMECFLLMNTVRSDATRLYSKTFQGNI